MVTLVLGKRGSGKTTLARSLLCEYTRVVVIDPLCEYSGPPFVGLKDLHEAVVRARGPFVFRFLGDLRLYDYVYGLALSWRNVLIVHEEIDLVCSANFVPPHLSDVIRRGRHYGISLLAVSRRPSEIPRLLTSQASRFYLFRFTEPRDLDYFARTFGPEIVEEIRALGDFQYLVRDA